MKKLLLLHGALGSSKQFERIVPLLQKDFEVHTFDFEGHGSFNSPREFSIDLFTNNLLSYLEQNHIGSIDIFGYSMGGYVALNTTLTAPERIGSIVTLGTKIDWNPETAAKEVKMLNPEKIAEKVPHYAEKLKQEHTQDWKEVLRKTGRLMLGLANGNGLTDDDFSKIEHPVTIGIGSHDQMVTIGESEKVSRLLPNGSLQILEGIQHPLDKINPEEVVTFVREYL